MASVFALGACRAMHSLDEPRVPAGHHFDYQVPGREQVHLVQVFDDGMKTYLQFQGKSDGVAIVQVGDDVPIAYATDQHYVILNGVFETVRVTLAGHSVLVRSGRSPLPIKAAALSSMMTDSQSKGSITMNELAAAKNSSRSSGSPLLVADWGRSYMADAIPAAVGVPEALQTMHSNLRVTFLEQEIAALEERVRDLTRQIAQAHDQERGAFVYVRNTAGLPRIALMFPDNSDSLAIDEDLRESLGTAARAANRIYLHGHTDAYVASEAGTALAIRRAVAVRAVLVALNVAPERIRLFYRGAGNFAANNSTAEGKALNRRVEVELRKW